MADLGYEIVRSQLLERKRRLEHAPELVVLLHEVDAALERIDRGTYGYCVVCHDPIEPERLLSNPLTCACLDHLDEGQRRALQQDLELALKIQQSLLPEKTVSAAGWLAAHEYSPAGVVSGDYCDLLPGKNGSERLFFATGDVSGKGIAASLVMSHLQAILRTLISLGLGAGEMVRRANQLLCESTMPSHYATLACGVASASGELELCNAGHCPPVVVHGRDCRTVAPAGLPVGLFCEGEYSAARLRLEPGDSLVLYTDGLTEAVNPVGEEYGLDRLCSVLTRCGALAPGALIGAVLADLSAFQAGAPRSDDLTMLVLQRALTSVS